jgi:hypothetical protein
MEGTISKGMPQAASKSRRRGDAEARMSVMVLDDQCYHVTSNH